MQKIILFIIILCLPIISTSQTYGYENFHLGQKVKESLFYNYVQLEEFDCDTDEGFIDCEISIRNERFSEIEISTDSEGRIENMIFRYEIKKKSDVMNKMESLKREYGTPKQWIDDEYLIKYSANFKKREGYVIFSASPSSYNGVVTQWHCALFFYSNSYLVGTIDEIFKNRKN